MRPVDEHDPEDGVRIVARSVCGWLSYSVGAEPATVASDFPEDMAPCPDCARGVNWKTGERSPLEPPPYAEAFAIEPRTGALLSRGQWRALPWYTRVLGWIVRAGMWWRGS